MEKIQYTIYGTNYVLIEQCVLTQKLGLKFVDTIKKYEGIVQSTTLIDRGLFYQKHILLKVLIPENRLIEFNKQNLL